MANVSRVNGFRPVAYAGAASTNLQLTQYYIPASDGTAIAVGDCVKIAGTADAFGVRGITKASVGDAICGVVCEFLPDITNLNAVPYRLASTARYVQICDDPNVLLEVQVSGTVATTDVGLNANFADAGITTSTGASGETLDGTTKATTATLVFKILNFIQRPDNDPTQTPIRVMVSINNHQLRAGTGTVGVA